MTIEEAIAHAKEQTEIFGGVHKEFLEMAIEALEKQMPKKRTYDGDEYDYCPNCGQAIDWSKQ